MISTDQLRAPLSGSPCVYWHTVEVSPAERRHEHGGGEMMIADATGAARVDLAGPVIFIRSDNYHEIAGPDWALHLETSLGEGDAVHVAGPVTLAPDRDAGGAHRGGVSPLFVGQADQPLIVTTRNPLAFDAELRFAAALAWTALGRPVLPAPSSLARLACYALDARVAGAGDGAEAGAGDGGELGAVLHLQLQHHRPEIGRERRARDAHRIRCG